MRILKIDVVLIPRRERGPALASAVGVRFRSRRSKVTLKNYFALEPKRGDKSLLLHVCCGPCAIMPITRLLDERAKKVSDTLDQADSRLAEAEAQKTEYTQQLAAARGEAARIVENARKQADLAYSRRLEEAEQAVQRLNEQAARQREADRAAMLAEAKQEIAALVMLTTAKVSQRTLNGETDQALLNQLLDEAGDGV